MTVVYNNISGSHLSRKGEEAGLGRLRHQTLHWSPRQGIPRTQPHPPKRFDPNPAPLPGQGEGAAGNDEKTLYYGYDFDYAVSSKSSPTIEHQAFVMSRQFQKILKNKKYSGNAIS